MKHLFILIAVVISMSAIAQPKPIAATPKVQALPPAIFNTLHDSCTSLDIVFLTGKGGSMSLEGRNVKYFTSFVSAQPTPKKAVTPQDGTIMWQINGKEYLSGNMFFTSDSSGYIEFNKNNKAYVNALTPQGAGFLQTHGK